jgi:hypothetical protein
MFKFSLVASCEGYSAAGMRQIGLQPVDALRYDRLYGDLNDDPKWVMQLTALTSFLIPRDHVSDRVCQ